jgi:hypothetical protein
MVERFGEFGIYQRDKDQEIIRPKGGDAGVIDYALDVPIGIYSGLSKAVQGLLQLGAMPVDYLANTNLLSGIENIFNKITPETKTGLGEITSVITQFGVPGGAALKIASGISKLKGISTMTELSSLGKGVNLAKGMELTKRAGYFGTIGGITDFAVSTPEKLGTLSDVLGVTEQTDFEGLSGQERALETIKSKIKFGAEGATLGAGIALAPTALSLGTRYGLIPAAKAIGTVGGVVGKVIDVPLTASLNAIVGKESKSVLQDAIITSGVLKDKALTKIGAKRATGELTAEGKPIFESVDWRHPVDDTFLSQVKRGVVLFADQFKSSRGIGSLRDIQVGAETIRAGEQRTLTKIGQNIQDVQNKIINNFKVKFTKDGDSMLSLQLENDKIGQILGSKDIGEIKEVVRTLPKEIRRDVIRYKKLIDGSQQKFDIFAEGVDVAREAALDWNSYSKQRFASLNNKDFKFNPLLDEAAIKEFKKINLTDRELINGFKEQSKTSGKTLDSLIEEKTKKDLLNFKQITINSDFSPETFYKKLTGDGKRSYQWQGLKSGQDMPDAIRRLLTVEEGRTAGELIKREAKDITGKIIDRDVATFNSLNAGLDVVLKQSEQIYNKKAFDAMLKEGLENGLIFDPTRAALKGVNVDKMTRFSSLKSLADGPRQSGVTLSGATSDLFTGNYYAAPEIANAIAGVKEATSKLYNIWGYKGLMTLKSAAQISKTILSPMTQIRNFTTAAMFPLASGLIGGRVGFRDAWRLTGDDIFFGAKTDLEKIGRIENLINRGVIDQNVNLNEIKRVLDDAKGGKLSFTRLMNSKPMQRLTDIYQGSDNYWKIYSDNFYQGALSTAFGSPSVAMKQGLDPKFNKRSIDELIKQGVSKEKASSLAFKNQNEANIFNSVEEWFQTVAGKKFNRIDPLTGSVKTPLQAVEEASAYLVTNTIPTYSKVPKIIDNVRNLPLGNFIAFPAEILRTSSNIFAIGVKELTSTNPFIRQMGARRLVGLSTVLGGAGYTIKKGAQYVTGVTDDEVDAFQRSFAPQYQRNSTLIPVTSTDENGNFKFYNFSYTNPYDALVTPVNGVLGAFSEGRLKGDNATSIIMNSLFGGAVDPSQRKGAITEFLSPFVTESIGTERAVDVTVRGGRDSRGKLIYDPKIDSIDIIIAKSINHILGGLTPGAVTSAQKIWQGATGQFTDYGTQRDAVDEFVALASGVRVEEAKPLASIPFIVTSFNKDKQGIRSRFADTAYSAATTPEEKLASYKDFILNTYNSQNKMSTVLEDAKTLGVDTGKLRGLLEQRLTKTETQNLLSKKFKVPTYSEEAFSAIIKRLENTDPFQAAKISEQNKVVQSIFRDLQRKLFNFPLGAPTDILDGYIEELLTPGVEQSRELIRNRISPSSPGPVNVQPRTELNSQITGAPVSAQVLTSSQQGQPGQQFATANLGQRYNLLPTSAERSEFLDRVVPV